MLQSCLLRKDFDFHRNSHPTIKTMRDGICRPFTFAENCAILHFAYIMCTEQRQKADFLRMAEAAKGFSAPQMFWALRKNPLLGVQA